jgi:hypothetical protein
MVTTIEAVILEDAVVDALCVVIGIPVVARSA